MTCFMADFILQLRLWLKTEKNQLLLLFLKRISKLCAHLHITQTQQDRQTQTATIKQHIDFCPASRRALKNVTLTEPIIEATTHPPASIIHSEGKSSMGHVHIGRQV